MLSVTLERPLNDLIEEALKDLLKRLDKFVPILIFKIKKVIICVGLSKYLYSFHSQPK